MEEVDVTGRAKGPSRATGVAFIAGAGAVGGVTLTEGRPARSRAIGS